jgi:hypothetical protein
MVLAFALGAVATVIKSDLRLPEGLYQALSVYLLFAIGLKGGVALSSTPATQIALPIVATLLLSVMTPAVAYLSARRACGLGKADAGALAAHYGSVSAVTFMAALSLTQAVGLNPEGYMPALVAVLEVPAILIGLLLARQRSGNGELAHAVKEVFTGKTIILLLGGMAVGMLTGKQGLQDVAPVFVDPFKGALVFFLLELGIIAGGRFTDLRGRRGLLIVAFGIAVPLFNGALGVYAGTLAGLSIGGAAVLGAMAASASYIAAPAAVRLAIPQASPGIYLTASLAVTFPFNLVIGIPLHVELARMLGG